MGLRILTVAWMQKESLLSIVSENWTHIFKSRKSEKPCMDYWAKKNRKNCHKACSKHVWTLGNDFRHFWNFERFLIFFSCFLSKSLPQKKFRKTELKLFRSGKLNSYFYVREPELNILSPESLKRNCVYWLWR